MSTVRVALLEMRPRLRDILTDALAREPDMDVVANEAPPEALSRIRPDVLVCGADDPLDPVRPKTLLALFPRSRVLIVAHSGRHAALFELRPTCLVLREVSMDAVVDAIRGPANVEDGQWPPFDLDPPGASIASGASPGGPAGHRGRVTWREKP